MKRAILFTCALLAAMLFVLVMLAESGKTLDQPGNSMPQPYDHSNCQYPERSTNPPNGCDNSDPCDPSNVKGGSGDCKDNSENDHEPIIEQPAIPAPAAECGGK